jgi:hypothetical protein
MVRRKALSWRRPVVNAPAKQIPHLVDPGDRVMTFREWCDERRISPSTGRRLIASGNGPAVIKLSQRRIGISVRADRAWLASRSA